jgi:hypothetical protein
MRRSNTNAWDAIRWPDTEGKRQQASQIGQAQFS